jgi:transcriptional regulator with XRE-family HTH domain
MGIVKTAAAALQIDDRELARRLGVSTGTLRHWDRKYAPAYVRFALAALVAGIDPDHVLAPAKSPQENTVDSDSS